MVPGLSLLSVTEWVLVLSVDSFELDGYFFETVPYLTWLVASSSVVQVSVALVSPMSLVSTSLITGAVVSPEDELELDVLLDESLEDDELDDESDAEELDVLLDESLEDDELLELLLGVVPPPITRLIPIGWVTEPEASCA